MTFTNYAETVAFWDAPSDKIKVVIFIQKDCTTCDDFVPDVLEKVLKEKSGDFEYTKVDVAEAAIPFPPLSTPTMYFKIPNTSEPMPLVRTGGVPEDLLRGDLAVMLRIRDEELTIAQAMEGTPYGGVNNWVQRQVRF